MHKHILLTLTMLVLPINAMEKQSPYIVYDIDSNTVKPDSFAVKLSQKYPCIIYSEQDKLSHQSPKVTRIHSQKYLENIDKHPSAMLSAINNNLLMSLYPNRYSKTYFDPMLNNIPATIIATERVITQKNTPSHIPNYAISCGQGYSFAGHAQGNNGDAYAAIPIAAAYALSTDTIKRILVIDENLNKSQTTVEQYYSNGNGSIFYQKNNPELTQLFEGKVVTRDKLGSDSLWAFLNSTDNDIDFTLYNVNIEDPDITNERKSSIYPLLEQLIPTVFILSGDKDKHQNNALSIIDYITESSQTIGTYAHHYAITPQQSPTKKPTDSSSNSQSNSYHFEHSSDNGSESSSETSSSHENDYNDTLVYKITTNPKNAQSYNGANFIYLAKKITINNGIMDVELHDDYPAYGQHYYHSPSSSDDSHASSDYSDSEWNEIEELNFK